MSDENLGLWDSSARSGGLASAAILDSGILLPRGPGLPLEEIGGISEVFRMQDSASWARCFVLLTDHKLRVRRSRG